MSARQPADHNTAPTPHPQEPLLEFRNVSRTFNSEHSSGFHDASFTIWPGDYIAVTGPSGAGKSTLLNVLGILDRCESGEYFFQGVDVNTLTERQRDRLRSRKLGFVFQSSFVLGDAPTHENAALGLRIQGMPIQQRSKAAAVAVHTLGLGAKIATVSRLLSGGERQRLAIARAIATQPDLILADEPTGNLDSKNAALVMRHLKELNDRGTTVIVVTHDESIANSLPSQIRIADGKIRSTQLAQRPRTEHTPHTPATETPSPPRPLHRFAERYLDDCADAFSAITQKVARSALLILAFTLGIAGVISAIAASESAAAQVTDRLTAASLDEVRVMLPDELDLLGADADHLQRWLAQAAAIPHVQSVAYEMNAPAKTLGIQKLHNGPNLVEQYEVRLMTTSANYLHLMESTDKAQQEQFSALHAPSVNQAAWVGKLAAEQLGTAAPGPGASVWIGNHRIDIIGTLNSTERAPNLDRVLIVSPDVLATAPELSTTMILRTEVGYPAAVAEALPLALDPANPGQFTIETVADLRELRFGVSNDLSNFVGLLSIVVLTLAAISASATMYLSVQSRTAEIALRRAIGASRADVGRLFLLEGLLIGGAGGALGSFIGTLTALAVSAGQGWTTVLPTYLVPAALLCGITAGFVSALAPALSASRKDPATAIRG